MKKILISVIVLFCAAILSALPITLEQSILIARENNRSLQAESLSGNSAYWSSREALANFFPRVSFNSTIVRIDDETYDQANSNLVIPQFGVELPPLFPVYRTTFNNNITIQQAIFNGGKVILGYQLSRLALAQAREALADKENELTYQVVVMYCNMLKLQDLQELAGKSLASSAAHLQMTEDKYRVGQARQTDVLQWQVKTQNDKTSVQEIGHQLNLLRSAWKTLLNTAEDYQPEPLEIDIYTPEIKIMAGLAAEELADRLNIYLTRVQTTNPALASLELVRKMMGRQYLMSKGNLLPSLNLQFTYEFENDDRFDFDGEDNWNLAAVISIPLFTAGGNYAGIRKARAELHKTELTNGELRENILNAARDSFYSMISTAQTVENNRLALAAARENYRQMNSLFEQGIVTSSDLLDAETMLYGTEMNLVSSYYDYIILNYEMKKWLN